LPPMVIALLYGCSLGAVAAFPADYVWRRRTCTLGPVPRMLITTGVLAAIAFGRRFRIYHGGWSFSGVIVGLVVGSLVVHASAARWWAALRPDRK
jgi:hypothetical protein